MLKAYDEKTGKEINEGDEVINFRGETGKFRLATRAREIGRSGKVVVDDREVYDNCYGIKVIEE